MAVVIGALDLALLWLARRRRDSGPLDLLDRRYARGDLTTQEYEERPRLLGGASR